MVGVLSCASAEIFVGGAIFSGRANVSILTKCSTQ